MTRRPDVIVIMTDEERAAPPYEPDELRRWRAECLTSWRWWDAHAVRFERHYTGSLACVPSRPTMFTGQYPDVHGVSQTDGLGKLADDSRMRWLRPNDVPTLGHWFRAAGYDTHYDGKWHMSHADLVDPATGEPLATNDAAGTVDPAAVQAYLDADPLDPFGFSGWVGPEPHGAPLANAGIRRDPLIAARVVTWLADRYERRCAGDTDALRPFLLVASFVNPHDIVLYPAWRRSRPLAAGPFDPPDVPPAPTAEEDLRTKPALQAAYRQCYPSAYGPAARVAAIYRSGAQEYRNLYYRLHAEVDGPVDSVRRAVTEGGSTDAVLVRTADHGELLGSHGGLHQKWYQLYDESTRVPFAIARIGSRATAAGVVDAMPTSHVDLVPTLLDLAGVDIAAAETALRATHREVHPLPGRSLAGVVADPSTADPRRSVYLLTRDDMLGGDTGASGLARRLGRGEHPPPLLRIATPAHVGSNVEGLVARLDDGHLWKIVRSFDDPALWTVPHVRHLASDDGVTYRTEPLPDEWELYDLDADPVEADNRAGEPSAGSAFASMREQLAVQRTALVPTRNRPRPYAPVPVRAQRAKRPPRPARALRRVVQRLGLHPPDRAAGSRPELPGRRALVVATNHAVLDVGKPTGVFASEMTVPYYAFADAGMAVDVASPRGGPIPVDPLSLKPVVRTAEDDRFLADERFRAQVTDSLAIGDVDIAAYDVVYLAGGWGAAFDLGTSEALGEQLTEANRLGRVIGGVCHGPLGLLKARAADGSPLVAGRHLTAVTDKQVRELGITATPQHPETELRRAGAEFESASRFRDVLANHWVVDGNLVTGQNQNAAPMVARELLRLAGERLTAAT